MDKQTMIQWLKIILLMLTVIAVGLFIINQFFAWHYKAEFLLQPCGLCKQMNPQLFATPQVVNNPSIPTVNWTAVNEAFNTTK